MSEAAIEFLKRAKEMYPQVDPKERMRTIPYLDELLSDKDFYEFLTTLYYYVEALKGTHGASEKMKEQFKSLDVEGYFIWQLQMFVQQFIQKEINKLGLNLTTE